MTPKAQSTKENIDQMDLIKLQKFCAPKDTIKEVKKQSTEWEKMLTGHKSDKNI